MNTPVSQQSASSSVSTDAHRPTGPETPLDLLGLGGGLLAGALWGAVFLGPRLLPDASPLLMTGARYSLYGILSLILILPSLPRVLGKLLGRELLWPLVRLSLSGNIIYFLLLTVAVHEAGVAAASLIVGLVPVVVTLWGSRKAGAVPLKALIGPLVLMGIGVGLISADMLGQDPHPGQGGDLGQRLWGLVCAGLALLSWSFYAVDNARELDRHSGINSHEWSLLTGLVTGALGLLLLVPALLNAPDPMRPGGYDPVYFWGVNSGIAIGASIIGNAAWNLASRRLPLTLSGQMIVFETLFALLYAFSLEGRWPRPLEILAILALLGGMMWSMRAHA